MTPGTEFQKKKRPGRMDKHLGGLPSRKIRRSHNDSQNHVDLIYMYIIKNNGCQCLVPEWGLTRKFVTDLGTRAISQGRTWVKRMNRPGIGQ